MEKQAPMKCPKCSQNSLYHNQGISQKNNRKYENYKCAKCDYIQWIPQDVKPTPPLGWNKVEKKVEDGDVIFKSEVMSYLKNIWQGITTIVDKLNNELPEGE